MQCLLDCSSHSHVCCLLGMLTVELGWESRLVYSQGQGQGDVGLASFEQEGAEQLV